VSNRERVTFPVTFEAKATVTFKFECNVELVPFQRNELLFAEDVTLRYNVT